MRAVRKYLLTNLSAVPVNCLVFLRFYCALYQLKKKLYWYHAAVCTIIGRMANSFSLGVTVGPLLRYRLLMIKLIKD